MWGFCADRDQRMLVYEYVPNGSLDKYLFAGGGASGGAAAGEENDNSSSSEQQQQPLLDLHTRYRIALGVARAIAYLHEECLEWVLHCDIKPENILLEDDFCPKVSDFGLSKLTSKRDKVTMSRIRGTRGYMAPEWVIHREPITAKADVYSFGMVLLEIVSGRRNYGFRQESVGSEDWYFPKWAYEKVYVERRIDDILDPRIAASYDDAASVATVERMVKTAMWCLQDRAEMRPSMGKVAKMLEGSVEITDPVKPTIFCVQDD
jgi:serine/threonine protein kinase